MGAVLARSFLKSPVKNLDRSNDLTWSSEANGFACRFQCSMYEFIVLIEDS